METQPVEPKNKGGRPEGALSKLSREARERAQASGKLPHEILLSQARGEIQWLERIDEATGEIKRVPEFMDLDGTRDAAKAAAPYYAPKLSAVELLRTGDDNELDAIIAELAAEAGIGLGTSREGTQDSSQAASVIEQPVRRRRASFNTD